MVFWVLAIVVIAGLGWFVWQKSRGPFVADKPAASELAATLVAAHGKAWSEPDDAFPVKKVDDIDAANRDFFGQDTPMTEVNGSGLVFKGARELVGSEKIPGPPPIPGEEMPASLGPRSAVFRFETDGSKGQAAGVRCTVCLQKYMLPRRDDGTDPLALKTSYTLKADGLEGGAPPILVYRQGGLVFYLISDKPGGYDLFKQAFGIPEPQESY
jgi:hypothetical protein